MKEALGMIETMGLIASIEASDVMLKVADVHLIRQELVKGGLVSVFVVGDVAAVQTAVSAGASAVERLNPSSLITAHVIPRPDTDVLNLVEPIQSKNPNQGETQIDFAPKLETDFVEDINLNSLLATENDIEEVEIEKVVTDIYQEMKQWLQNDIVIAQQKLGEWKIADVRAFAKELVDFSISKKMIYRSNKQDLIEAILAYFAQ